MVWQPDELQTPVASAQPDHVAGATKAQVLPFQMKLPGQTAMTAAALTLVEPHELLAVAMQFVVPEAVAAKAPLPPVEGVSVYHAALAPEQLITTVTGLVPEELQPTE